MSRPHSVEPAGDQLAHVLALDRRGARLESQPDVLALVLAEAVAVRVGVAGLVEQLVGPGDVEAVGLLGGGLVVGVEVGRPLAGRHDRRRRPRVPAPADLDHLLLVDRPGERLAEADVPEHRVAQRGVLAVAVEAQVVPGEDVALEALEAVLLRDLRVLRRRHVVGGVEGADLEVLRHRVGVGVELEVDLVDGRLGAPVVGVLGQKDVAAPLPLLRSGRAPSRRTGR